MFKSMLVIAFFVSSLCGAAETAAAPKLEMKEAKKQTTLVMKREVKEAGISAALGEILPKIHTYLDEQKVQPVSAPFASFEKTDTGAFRMEAGFAVPPGTKGSGDIVESSLPGGHVVYTLHTGPYTTLGQVHEAALATIKAKGLKPAPVSWEVYVSDPGSTKPEELKTEIYIPIQTSKKD